MFYQETVTVPAKTPEDEPVIRRLEVYPGVTQHVWIGFPRGCAGLAHLTVEHQGVQVWPTSGEEDYSWDNFTYSFDDSYPITSEPYQFVIKCWNEDDAYPHTLVFAVTIEHTPPEERVGSLESTMREMGFTVRS